MQTGGRAAGSTSGQPIGLGAEPRTGLSVGAVAALAQDPTGAGIEMGAGVAAGPHCPGPKDRPVRACPISPGRSRLRRRWYELSREVPAEAFRPRSVPQGSPGLSLLRSVPCELPPRGLRRPSASRRSSFLGLAASSGPPRVPSPAPCGRRRFPLRVPRRGPKASHRFPRNASSRFDPPFGIPPGRRSEPKLRRIGLSRFLRPGGSGSAGRRSGKWVRLSLSRRPRASSVCSPRLRFDRFTLAGSMISVPAIPIRALRFRRAASRHKWKLSCFAESAKRIPTVDNGDIGHNLDQAGNGAPPVRDRR